MNKNLHRVIFSAARGMRVAVQETARSAGKAPGTASGIAGAALAALLASPAHAQIAGAANVPGDLRPTVLRAANGVPVVNIQTPSAAGVSRNVYRQFDVQGPGAILNNSRTNVQTQLGGFVQGNPWLGQEAARVILNEINSGHPTHLRGAIEVAGRRAEVIVANPAGITVNGGTFIHTSRATLTTGVPQFNAAGGLEGFVVREGRVSIEGLGLDARSTDYAAIIARAEQINASIWANRLALVSGANEVSADLGRITPIAGSGARPGFALDVAHVGGMYAGNIFIVGTEAGLGVRNHGGMYAGMGEFAVTVDGRFENRGTIEAPRVDARADEFDNRQGTIRQTGSAGLAISAPMLSNTVGGVVGAGLPAAPSGVGGGASTGAPGAGAAGAATGHPTPGAVGATGTAPPQAGVPQAPGRLAARGGILNDGGRILADGGISLQVPWIDNTAGFLSVTSMAVTGASFSNAGGTLDIRGAFAAHVDRLDNTNGILRAGSLDIAIGGDFTNRNGMLASDGDAALAIGGRADNIEGVVSAAGDLRMDADTLDSTGVLSAGGALRLVARRGLSAQGIHQAGGAATLQGAHVDLAGSHTRAGQLAISATQGGVRTRGASLTSLGTLTIAAVGALDNREGRMQAVGDLRSNAGALDNTSGLIRSLGTTALNGTRIVNANTAGTDQGIEGDNVALTLRGAGTLDNTRGAIRANTDTAITSAGLVDNTHGLISGRNALHLADANGASPAASTLSVVNTHGTLAAGTMLTLEAMRFSGDGKTASGKDLRIALVGDTANHSELSVGGNLAYATTGTLANHGKLRAGGTLLASGHDVDNTATGEMTGRDTVVTASGTLTQRGLIDSHGKTWIDAGTLDNKGTGRVYGGDVSIQAVSLDNDSETVNGTATAATIAARERLDIGARFIRNREHALIFSGAGMSIGGKLDANRRAVGQASVLENASATIESLGDMRLGADRVRNLNTRIRTEQVSSAPVRFLEHAPDASPTRLSGGVYDRKSASANQKYADYTTAGGQVVRGNRWTIWDYERSSSRTRVVAGSSDPAQILSGGNLSYTGNELRNENSRILIGGTLKGDAGALQNVGLDGVERTRDVGTVTSSYTQRRRYDWRMRDRRFETQTAYDVQQPDRSFTLNEFSYEDHAARRGSHVVPVGAPAGAAANSGAGAPPGTIIEVASAGGAGSAMPRVARTSAPSTALPAASLFALRPDPGSRYLVETDPRFANHRNWLASDYMLDRLGLDPHSMLKRLGDGFHEQRLIREQVAQLTGFRYLEGFQDDEAQYIALMNSGLTFAKQYGLRPGIALSAAQMAQLTSDIVWLVEQTVTLPDGSAQRVLAPQVYVRLRPGDIDGSGALLSARVLEIKGQGDLVNTGTIAGREAMVLDADNVHNLGGRMDGGSIGIGAVHDLNNIGGRITARDAAVLAAGGDINLRTTTDTQTGPQGSRTGIDRVAGVYVSNPGGVLVASAGHDVNLIGAILANSGKNGRTHVVAGNDLNLGTVATAGSDRSVWDALNHRSESFSAEVGSQIQAEGSVRLDAGNDVHVRAGSVEAGGALAVVAGRNVTIEDGKNSQRLDEAHENTSKGLLSSHTVATRDQIERTDSIASNLGGATVDVTSGNDLRVVGSHVVSDSGTTFVAKNDIRIEAASNDARERHTREERKSGIFGSGGIGFTIGRQQQETDGQTETTTAARSVVGSLGGDVRMTAGNSYRQTGSDVLAPEGGISIIASKVDIAEARETRRSETSQKQQSSGLTVALTAPVVTSVQNMANTTQAIGDAGNARMKALGAASVAMDAKTVADAAVAAAAAADPAQAMGVNLALSIGGSRSESHMTERSDTARGSSVRAGGDVTIAATGAQGDGDLRLQGSDIRAGKDAALIADGRVHLLAARNDSEQHGTSKSSSASIGVSFGTSGFLVNASASGARGRSNGTDTSYTHARVGAGDRATVISGGDTVLRGAVIAADRVEAAVGGDLAIESVQDSGRSESRQQSAGASVSVGAGVWSANASVHDAKAREDYATVTEQSGIRAGEGGFDVRVEGATSLKGGVIGSARAAADEGRNLLSTRTLTVGDIQNRSSGSATSGGVAVGSDMLGQGKYGVAKAVIGSVLGKASVAESSTGTTRSAVSPGRLVIADDAGQRAATGRSAAEMVASLNRDTAAASVPVGRQDAHQLARHADAHDTIAGAAIRSITVPADDAYKTMFRTDAKFYRVTCGGAQGDCMNDPSLVRMQEIDAETARREGRVLAVNGIFNSEVRAGQLAYQNASLNDGQSKPAEISLMHIAPAATTIGELLVAAYEQMLAPVLGYTQADHTYASLLLGRGNQDTISMGHSRGTIVQTHAFNIAGDKGYRNRGLFVEGVGMAVPTSTYIAAASRVSYPDKDVSNVSATYMTNDPVSVIAARNPGDVLAAIREFGTVIRANNSAHSCYGTGASGCVTIASPVAEGPQPLHQRPESVVVRRNIELAQPGEAK